MLPSLLHKLAHRAADRQRLGDTDIIIGHAAADLVLAVGEDALHIGLRAAVEPLDQSLLLVAGQIVQHVHGVVGVHTGDDLRGQLHRQLVDIRLCVVEIGKNLGHPLRAEEPVQLAALVRRQAGHGLGDVLVVIVRKQFRQALPVAGAADQLYQLRRVVLVTENIFLHCALLQS